MQLVTLRNRINTVKPAIAESADATLFGYYWFDGKKPTACKGRELAIKVDCETPFPAALPCALYDLLDSLPSDGEASFTGGKNGVVMTVGESTTTFAVERWDAVESVLGSLSFKPSKDDSR